MISVIAFEVRRAMRRRLTVLVILVPLVLIVYAAVGKWTGHPPRPLTPALVILTSSLVVFGQALLSDREGGFDAALVTAPLPRKFLLIRQGLLLALPIVLQWAVYRALAGLLGLA
ncbi:MAG: hypothetical protein Q7T82_18625 [Armatimonadota bacterium]|nr:hypothetical protein [Armatimonadota bacterium]